MFSFYKYHSKSNVLCKCQRPLVHSVCQFHQARRTCPFLLSPNPTTTGFYPFQDEESPDIDFVYTDTDSFANEMSEFYSYTENPEFRGYRESYEKCLQRYKMGESDWHAMDEAQK